jgi:hypothetical protein
VKLLVVDHDNGTLDAIAAGIQEDEVRLLGACNAESSMALLAREQPQIGS